MSCQKKIKIQKSPSQIKPEDKKQYKFDINPKNYECFIKKFNSKPDKKKNVKSKTHLNHIIKQDQSNKCAHDKNSSHSSKNRDNMKSTNLKSEEQLFKLDKQKIQEVPKKQLSHSPDLLKISMNQVIYKIQKEGVESKWDQDEQIKKQLDVKTQTQFHQLCTHQNYIWTQTQPLSVINQNDFSVISTKQTNFSGSNLSLQNNYFSNSTYIEYPHHMVQYRNHYSYTNSYNNSFSYQSEQIFNNSQLYTYDQRDNYARRVFEMCQQHIIKDGRTTVMIKNIPNKYSLKLLSQEIDEKHDNQYDFLYLPFDFNNNCNVGYAFINFLNTEYLYSFYKEFNHKKWSKFRSEKICVLTYARLQGRHSLVEHFYNTKVFNQKEKRYRPIIRDLSKIEELLKKQRSKK